MRTFILGTLAALTLSLGVTSSASADWRYRERARFEYGRRIVYQERYWAPAVVVTVPAPVVVAPPVAVEVTTPVFTTGYFYGTYQPYYRHPHRFYRR